MPIKSFRGLIGDNKQDTIVLHTNDGSTGYKIVKFQLMPTKLNFEQASTVKIFTIPQTGTPTDVIDFSDQTLLATGTFSQDNTSQNQPETMTVIFDNTIFNQDIYLTHIDSQDGVGVNYYIELEQVKLDLSENTVATLKDIRNIKGQ